MRRGSWGWVVVFACLTAVALACGVLVRPGAAKASAASSPAPAPSPTIVSPVIPKETMYSNTYRLSDGSYQAQIYAAPIRFKDAQGAWQTPEHHECAKRDQSLEGLHRQARPPPGGIRQPCAEDPAGDGLQLVIGPPGQLVVVIALHR